MSSRNYTVMFGSELGLPMADITKADNVLAITIRGRYEDIVAAINSES